MQTNLTTSGCMIDLQAWRQESIRREEEQRRTEQVQALLNAVPVRFQKKAWGDFHLNYAEQTRCKQVAQKFVASFTEHMQDGTCLKFLGNAGTGKTLLALIMYQALAKQGIMVKYHSSLHFLRQLQEKEFESHAAYQYFLNSYQMVKFLIIDEVSVGSGKGGNLADWQRSHLYTLINQRYINKLCTLVISNHTHEELLERLGEPTVGRLAENGVTLAFNWPSYRKSTL